MKRCRLGITAAVLAMHLLAPVGAYAAVRPATFSSDYCSSPSRASLPSSDLFSLLQSAPPHERTPAARHHRHVHTHCPSCLGAGVVAAIFPTDPALAVRPFAQRVALPERASCSGARAAGLLPPLRGPPSVLL